MAVSNRSLEKEESLASKTVGAIAEKHGFPDARRAIGELMRNVGRNKNFGLFLKDSVGLFDNHGAKPGSMDYALNMMRKSGSTYYDVKKFEDIGSAYPHTAVMSESGKFDARTVAKRFAAGTKATANDKEMVEHMFNFYRLALKKSPALSQAISKLGR